MDFLCFKGDEPCYYEELVDVGSKFYFVTKRSENYIKNIRETYKVLKENKFDIIHCHLNSLSYITPCIIGKKLNMQIILHAHNAGCLQGKKSIILHTLNKARIKNQKLTKIAVSKEAGEWFFGKNENVTVLYNGIEVDKFAFSQLKRAEIRNEFGLADKKVIVNVGAFRKQKNHERIVSIFADFLKEESNSILMLVGIGELQESIRHKVEELKIQNNVIFTGNRTDIDKILSASDMFLFPSFYEGFPIALIEAECSGLKCIISDCITEQSQVKELCYPVSLKEDNSVWVKALQQCDQADRKDGALLVEKSGFGIESEIQQLENLYIELAKRRI